MDTLKGKLTSECCICDIGQKEAISLVTEWLLCHEKQIKSELEDRILYNKNVFRKCKINNKIENK